jgi:hypothetical protein
MGLYEFAYNWLNGLKSDKRIARFEIIGVYEIDGRMEVAIQFNEPVKYIKVDLIF